MKAIATINYKHFFKLITLNENLGQDEFKILRSKLIKTEQRKALK